MVDQSQEQPIRVRVTFSPGTPEYRVLAKMADKGRRHAVASAFGAVCLNIVSLDTIKFPEAPTKAPRQPRKPKPETVTAAAQAEGLPLSSISLDCNQLLKDVSSIKFGPLVKA